MEYISSSARTGPRNRPAIIPVCEGGTFQQQPAALSLPGDEGDALLDLLGRERERVSLQQCPVRRREVRVREVLLDDRLGFPPVTLDPLRRAEFGFVAQVAFLGGLGNGFEFAIRRVK